MELSMGSRSWLPLSIGQAFTALVITGIRFRGRDSRTFDGLSRP
jgi:hypothetical protein